MTPHDLMIIFAGLLFVCASMALWVTGRLLGPEFDGQMTIGPLWRAFFWLLSGITALRGLTLMFPADLVAIQLMSVVMPLEAAAFCALSVFVLNFVMADRAPPPLVERVLRMVGGRLTDREIIDLTMALPAAEHAITRAPETTEERQFRHRVMAFGASLAALAIAALVWNSPVLG